MWYIVVEIRENLIFGGFWMFDTFEVERRVKIIIQTKICNNCNILTDFFKFSQDLYTL